MEKLVSVVIPVFDEAAVLDGFHARLVAVLERLPHRFEVIYVDDGSGDGSRAVLRALAARDARVCVIGLARNFGHQAALTAGMDHCRGDAVICMDADLQHPPETIPALLRSWEQGCDIVYAVRRSTSRQGLAAGVSVGVFYRLFNRLSGRKIHANAADFRLVSGRVAAVFRADIRERHRFLRGLVGWVGFTSGTVEYDAAERAGGRSKYTLLRRIQFALDGITSFSLLPLRASLFVGLVVAAACVLYGVYVVGLRLFTDRATSGWASIAALLAFTNALLLVFIGIIGEYVGRVYEEVKGRPIYIVAEVLGGGVER